MMAEDISEDTAPLGDDAELAPEAEIGGDGWSGADIEDAYRKALEAMEDIPWEESVSAADSDSLPADRPPAPMGERDNSPVAGDAAPPDINDQIPVPESSATGDETESFDRHIR